VPHQPAGSGRVLSPRELEVVRRAGAGLSNKQIGLELGITPETVETHLKRARSKLGAVSRRGVCPQQRGTPTVGDSASKHTRRNWAGSQPSNRGRRYRTQLTRTAPLPW
jgi:DNA-binding CsgD family transcriptional regulator